MKRLIFKVDLGNLPKHKAEAHLKKVMEVVKSWRTSTTNECLVLPGNVEVIEVDV